MTRSWSIVAVAVGAIGVAVLLWLKRRQLALAAAKAVPKQVSAAGTEQAAAVADAIVEQRPSAS